MFQKKKQTFTNWVTKPDGTIVQSSVGVKKGGIVDGMYEVEVLDGSIGVILETDFYRQHTIVKEVGSHAALQDVMASGHVLVAVNNRYVVNEEFEDVISFLTMLRASGMSRKMRFLDPSKCPVAVYEEKIAMQMKSQKDIYGFLRSAEYIEAEREALQCTSQKVAKRDLAWVRYLKAIGGVENLKPAGRFTPSYPLKMMVRRGIPAAFRPLVWKHISMSDQYRQAHPSGYYADLVSRIAEDLSVKVRDDIDKDLLRTFPDHDYFRSGEGLACLCRVLSAYALHNPEVAYCQSINFLAGTVLLYLEEEDGFWLLCTLLDCFLPSDQYSRSMIGTYVDQAVLGHIVKTRFPVLHRKLEEFQLELSLMTIQWFMCVFVNTLRAETALRVWDVLLNEGDKVLFRVAVSLIYLHEDEIEAASDAAALHKCLKGIGSNITDADVLMSLAYKDFDDSFDPVSACAPSYSILSPRPSSWSKKILQFRKVPPQLEGIGVGHLGPQSVSVSTPPPTPPPVEEEFSPEVSPLEQTNAVDIEAPSFSSSLTTDMEFTIREEKSSPGEFSDEQKQAVRQTFAELIRRRKSRSPRASERRIRAENYHRAFGRSEIAEWRSIYRPSVESTIAEMEANRKKWRARETCTSSADHVGVDEVVAGGSVAVTDTETEDTSTVSTVGDDNGAAMFHFDTSGNLDACTEHVGEAGEGHDEYVASGSSEGQMEKASLFEAEEENT